MIHDLIFAGVLVTMVILAIYFTLHPPVRLPNAISVTCADCLHHWQVSRRSSNSHRSNDAIAKRKSTDSALVLPATYAVVDDGVGNGWQARFSTAMHQKSDQC
jgi:hypothetical protein